MAEDEQAWQDWIRAACAAVGVDPSRVEVPGILGLAGVVAHGVARPMAPVTAYIAGLAVGAGGDADEVVATLRGLVG